MVLIMMRRLGCHARSKVRPAGGWVSLLSLFFFCLVGGFYFALIKNELLKKNWEKFGKVRKVAKSWEKKLHFYQGASRIVQIVCQSQTHLSAEMKILRYSILTLIEYKTSCMDCNPFILICFSCIVQQSNLPLCSLYFSFAKTLQDSCLTFHLDSSPRVVILTGLYPVLTLTPSG